MKNILPIVILFFSFFGLGQKATIVSDLNSLQLPIIKTELYSTELPQFSYYKLYLNADSTFYIDSGIEQHQNMYFGKVKKENNELTLTNMKICNFGLVRNVELIGSLTNDSVTFIIQDKSGHPIKNFEIVSLSSPSKNKRAISFTDKSGKVIIDIRNVDYFQLFKLESISGNKYEFKNSFLTDSIIITVNLNEPHLKNFQQKLNVLKKPLKYTQSNSTLITKDCVLILDKEY